MNLVSYITVEIFKQVWLLGEGIEEFEIFKFVYGALLTVWMHSILIRLETIEGYDDDKRSKFSLNSV